MKEVDIISKVVGRDTSGKTAMYIPGAGAPSVNLDDYLLKKIWDSVFEIRTDGEGNPYLFEKLPFVTQYGITMYANGGNLNLPSIYAGLPIDGSTLIRDANGVLMINPDIDLGGASTWDELIGKPSWIGSTKPSYNYSEILQTPDLSVYALAKDLEKYVTLNTEQTIAAHKNFLNGLSVGGLGITKSQDDVVYINANLVVRGGITMYATDTVDIPSIIDSLPTASTSAKGLASFDPNFFSVDADGNVSFIGSTGGVDESVLSQYAKKTDLSAYLSLNGGQMTGNIGYTLSPDSYGVGIPAAGLIPNYTSVTDFTTKKSFMGNGFNTTNDKWYNIISVRADNGSTNYGMYIASSMTDYQGNLTWNKQEGYNGDWQGERVILDSVNWSQYITAGDGGNYLPLSGGTISPTGTYVPLMILSQHNQGVIIKNNGNAIETTLQYLNPNNVAWTTGINIKNYYHDCYCIYSQTTDSNIMICRGYDKRTLFSGALEVSNTDGTTYATNGISVGTGDISQRYITCYGKDLGYINIGKAPSNGNAGEISFQYYSSGSTSNYLHFAMYGSSNVYLRLYYNSHTQIGGNLLTTGGITMYSDIRKKTKLQDVELSLKQIADAPLIEHYYNSDSNKTTHVGSIAQYWAETIGNDWFCKLDSEGFYTMEIQNAALASAISIARELVKYESKTDRKIRLLKQRVKELENKIEKLEKK